MSAQKQSQLRIANSSKFALAMLILSFLVYSTSIILKDLFDYLFSSYINTLIILISLCSMYAILIFFTKFNNLIRIFFRFILFPVLFILIFLFNEHYVDKTGVNRDLMFSMVLFAILVILILYTVYLCYLPLPNIRWNLLYVIIGTLIFFVIGSIIINDFTVKSNNRLELHLNYCNMTRINLAQVKCGVAYSKDIFVGSYVGCEITNYMLNKVSGEMRFTFYNGSVQRVSFKNAPSFLVQPGMSRFVLELKGFEPKNNITICASTGTDITFSTYDELKQQKKELGLYMIGLIVFVLLSVPPIILSWKKVI